MPRPRRRWTILGVVAVLALSLTVVTASGGSSSSRSSHAGDAVAAKKKCKKKGKKSAETAKKKKCKKKKRNVAPPVVTPPAPPPPSGPVVRAEVSWTVANPAEDQADIDVHAWFNGAHTGYSEAPGSDGDDLEIPNLVLQPDLDAPGLERIVDLTNPSTRPLTFAICSYDFDGFVPAEVTYHFVFSNGSVLDGTESMNPGDIEVIDPVEGGSVDPPMDWCPDSP